MSREEETGVVTSDLKKFSNHPAATDARSIATVIVGNGKEGAKDDDDDWHLLEPEKELSADHSQEEEGKARTMAKDPIRKSSCGGPDALQASDISDIKASAKMYIELDPLGPRRKYSGALMHLCTALYSLIPLASLLALFTLFGLLFTRYYFISLLYLGWIMYDRDTCNRGGRRVNFVYYSAFWTHLAAYFSIRLRHPQDFKLDPRENYILNYHPHGIASLGSVCTFSTNGLNFDKFFPGIKARFLVHEFSFVLPVVREVFGLRGDCSVNSKSIDYILSQKNRRDENGELAKDCTGNVLAIVVGGLAEADLSDCETLKIVLLERKGFIKKALIHGANLIPCIAFGENSVFTRVELSPSSFWKQFETRWYNLFKFKQPIYHGRSLISENSRGLMPYKRPITVVMGNPIPVESNESPSQAEIDQLHANYIAQLKELYEANKDLCKNYDKKLELV